MRRLFYTCGLLVRLCLIFLLGASSVYACNLTQTTLLSVVPSGGAFTISTQLCVGAGRTGGVNGADGDTQDLIFGFYRQAGPLVITGFTPANITSSFRLCTMPGIATGPIPFAPFNVEEGIYYQFFAGNPGCTTGFNQSFTCVVSTAQCGNVHSDCFNISITIDQLPDSLRVFGVEGAGNPTSGCYPNPDMMIDFTILPVVWASFEGKSLEIGNQLDWKTEQEINSERFEIMRSADGVTFESIGSVASIGGNNKGKSYTFLDPNPIQGLAQYKIRQFDFDGRTSESEVLTLTYTPPSQLAWAGVGPLPAHDQVSANFVSEKDRSMELLLVNTAGQVVRHEMIAAKAGSNHVELDLSGFAPGMYFMRLQGSDARLDYKLMKL
jgi:hypothetical protein